MKILQIVYILYTDTIIYVGVSYVIAIFLQRTLYYKIHDRKCIFYMVILYTVITVQDLMTDTKYYSEKWLHLCNQGLYMDIKVFIPYYPSIIPCVFPFIHLLQVNLYAVNDKREIICQQNVSKENLHELYMDNLNF